MARVDRWRRWYPTAKKFDGAAKEELTKLTEGAFDSFVSSNSACGPNFSLISNSLDAAAWAESFHRWMLERCIFRMRSFGGIDVLHCDFCDWSDAHDEPPPSRQDFDRLLASAGLFLANGLVSGLILRNCLVSIRQARHPQEEDPTRLKRGRHTANWPSQLSNGRSKRNDS